VERKGYRGKKTLMADGQRSCFRLICCQSAQGYLLAARRAYINLSEELRILPELRRRLHHNVVLVQRGVHRGHLALAERVVKSIVDQLGLDAEAGSRRSVIADQRLQTLVLQIAVYVRDEVDRLQFVQHFRRISNKVRQTVALHGELVLGAALPAADADILRRLKDDCSARQFRELRTKAGDNLLGRGLPVGKRFQGNEHPRRIGAAREAERFGHAGVRLNDADGPPQNRIGRLERRVLIGEYSTVNAAVILLREEAFRYLDEHIHCQRHGGQQNCQSDG